MLKLYDFCFFQRIGYLAASQSFHDGTDVLMLTTNMIRKVTSFEILKKEKQENYIFS